LNESVEAPIDFKRFDGRHFPVADRSFDVVLFCYVLHHAQDIAFLMHELRRVLGDGGSVVVYEDIPARIWDRVVCGLHNLKWSKRTGSCTFKAKDQWRETFEDFGFEVVSDRPLSRWRNLAHPVSRRLYILRAQA
jgi:ubiquinone/menaquinone biosynthesis C-methylase UbiE